MNRVQIKQRAKQRFRENKWNMVLTALVYSVLAGICVSPFVNVNININDNLEYSRVAKPSTGVIIVCVLATIFILNIIEICVKGFFRDNIYENQKVDTLPKRFTTNYGNNVLTMFITTVIISIGTCLFFIPGIILSYGLALVPYILAENPELGVVETLKLSWDKMKGHKWECFVLSLSFIGWALLSAITLGLVGIFYSNPYQYQTFAIYFDNVLGGKEPEVIEVEAEIISAFEE